MIISQDGIRDLLLPNENLRRELRYLVAREETKEMVLNYVAFGLFEPGAKLDVDRVERAIKLPLPDNLSLFDSEYLKDGCIVNRPREWFIMEFYRAKMNRFFAAIDKKAGPTREDGLLGFRPDIIKYILGRYSVFETIALEPLSGREAEPDPDGSYGYMYAVSLFATQILQDIYAGKLKSGDSLLDRILSTGPFLTRLLTEMLSPLTQRSRTDLILSESDVESDAYVITLFDSMKKIDKTVYSVFRQKAHRKFGFF